MGKGNRDTFNFENLLVNQKSLDYIDLVYLLVSKFPKEETLNLSSQFKRAANSVSLNIGEGSAGTVNEFKNFIRISFRSLNECVVCTTVTYRRGFINDTDRDRSRMMLLEMTRMLSGLKNSLDKK